MGGLETRKKDGEERSEHDFGRVQARRNKR